MVRPSTVELPVVTALPAEQLTTWLTATCPTETGAASRLALSTLALAASTPAAERVSARGSLTVSPPVGCTPATCWLSLAHGLPGELAMTGSDMTVVPTLARAAEPRHVVLAACALAAPITAQSAKADTAAAAHARAADLPPCRASIYYPFPVQAS